MRREQLEHILRAACQIVDERELLVIGSQAILGTYSEHQLPSAAIRSMEADVAAFDDPDESKADRIDGAIGEDSQFHERFGVYAQGVSVATAVLPSGWRSRLVRLESPSTQPGAGLCLERHDLVLSKLARGETRDYEFATALMRAGLLEKPVLAARLNDLRVSAPVKAQILAWLGGVEAVS